MLTDRVQQDGIVTGGVRVARNPASGTPGATADPRLPADTERARVRIPWTVLVVSDDFEERAAIVTALRDEGHDVLCHGCPRRALAICRALGDRLDVLAARARSLQIASVDLARRAVSMHPGLRIIVWIDGSEDAGESFELRETLPRLGRRHAVARGPQDVQYVLRRFVHEATLRQ